jgi:hypothetical protein
MLSPLVSRKDVVRASLCSIAVTIMLNMMIR